MFGATVPLLLNPAFAQTTLGQNLPALRHGMLSIGLVALFVLIWVEHSIVPPRPVALGPMDPLLVLRAVGRAAVRRHLLQQPAGAGCADPHAHRPLPGVPGHREGLSRWPSTSSPIASDPVGAVHRPDAGGAGAAAARRRGGRGRRSERRQGRPASAWSPPALLVAGLSLYLAAMLLTVRPGRAGRHAPPALAGRRAAVPLVRGPVTRVALAGDEAARLRPRFGALGWAVGRAVLRGDEQIDLCGSRRPHR